MVRNLMHQQVIIKKEVSQSKKNLCYTIAIEFCIIDLIHWEKYNIGFPIGVKVVGTNIVNKVLIFVYTIFIDSSTILNFFVCSLSLFAYRKSNITQPSWRIN